MTVFRSTRSRLMLWYSGVLLLALALSGVAIYSFLRQDLMRDLDQRLMEKARGVEKVLELEGVGDLALGEELDEFAKEVGHGDLLALMTESGEALLPVNGKPFVSTRAAGLNTVGPNRVYVANFQLSGTRFTVAAGEPLNEIDRTMSRLRAVMWIVAVPTLLIAGMGGYWLSRRALAPVDTITRAARSISVENLSQRLPQPQTGDEIERLAGAWNELLERLETSVQKIQQFTTDASHELRTPVSLIRSTAELALRRDRDPQAYRKALEEIELEARRMTELTESMLLLARADSGARLPLSPVDLNGLVREVARATQPLAQAKGIRLDAALEAAPAVMPANEAGVRRLLRILVDNALEHTPAGGKVGISVNRQNGTVTLAVRDSGEGIPAEALPHIFERFYRADEARGGRRVGLGLSLAQVIAQAHGSEIEVESARGSGSCFRLRFGDRLHNL